MGASPFENLKYLNKSENSSCSKVTDVGIQNDRIWTTITEKKSKIRSEFAGPRNGPKTVQICTPKHNDKIWSVFEQFLGVVTSNPIFLLLFCDRAPMPFFLILQYLNGPKIYQQVQRLKNVLNICQSPTKFFFYDLNRRVTCLCNYIII